MLRIIFILISLYVYSFSYANTSNAKYIIKFKNNNYKNFNALFSKNIKKSLNAKTLNLFSGDYLIVQSHNESDDQIIQNLKTNPNIEFVEKDVQYYPLDMESQSVGEGKDYIPQDKYWTTQWGLYNSGTNNWLKGPENEDLQILKAWKITTGSPNVTIAVIDSGIQLDHPDFEGNIFVNEVEKNGVAGVDDDHNGFIDDINGWDFANNDNIPDDNVGHGTHTSGIIGAKHNLLGTAGVMNQVKILPLKFLDKGGGSTSNAIQAIDYAIRMGAKVINNSWGGGEFSEALKDVIQKANEHGIFVVCAAGNSKMDNDKTPMYPASYAFSNVISVGSSNGLGKLSWFSNFGSQSVHVFAPGSDIVSTAIGSKWAWKSGTSNSAPFVSGVLGLLLSVNPSVNPQEGKDCLINSSYKNPLLASLGVGGRVDAFNLLMTCKSTHQLTEYF